MTITIAALVWAVCCIYDAGLFYTYLQRESPSCANMNRLVDGLSSCATSLLGPVSLLATHLVCGGELHGWLLPFTRSR